MDWRLLVAQRKEAIRAALARMHEFDQSHINHHHANPCEFCNSHRGQYSRLVEEYSESLFVDSASIVAVIELLGEVDPEVKEFALHNFNPWILDRKADKEMVAVLLPYLTDLSLTRLIHSMLVMLNRSEFTPEQLRLVMAAVEVGYPKGYTYGGRPVEDVLFPYILSNPEVLDFVVRRAVAKRDFMAVLQLASVSRDPVAYQTAASFLEDSDPRLQNEALSCLRRGTGADMSAANPSVRDYVSKLVDLYGKSPNQEVRKKIAVRMIEFDTPQAAQAMGSILRDGTLERKTRSEALNEIVTRARFDKENLYPSSKDQWLLTLQSVGQDTTVESWIRLQAYWSWLAVRAIGRESLDEETKGEILQVIGLFDNDPDPGIRQWVARMREQVKE